MNIYEKLAAARKIIRTAPLKKAGKNSYSNYDYFTPEQVEELVSKACEQTNTLCLTSLTQDQYGYSQILKFIDLEVMDKDMKPATITFELRTASPEIKATNATQQMGGMDTYSERYIKMKVFQIKDNNLDFDSQDNRIAAPKTAKSSKQFPPTADPKLLERKEDAKSSAEHDAANIPDNIADFFGE